MHDCKPRESNCQTQRYEWHLRNRDTHELTVHGRLRGCQWNLAGLCRDIGGLPVLLADRIADECDFAFSGCHFCTLAEKLKRLSNEFFALLPKRLGIIRIECIAAHSLTDAA